MDDVLLAEWLPDVQELFAIYDAQYFDNLLSNFGCKLEWSDRMTRCAGLCYSRRQGHELNITIRLSRPLLSLRPFRDTINTLLHEMIHAYLFIKAPATGLDRDGHGPAFISLMQRINEQSGSQITVYHSFHAEVALQQRHVWRCDGPCQQMPPFYGWCKRSLNRPPQPADWWYARHQRECGGRFHKCDDLKAGSVEVKAVANAGLVKVEACALKPAVGVQDASDYFAQFASKGQRIRDHDTSKVPEIKTEMEGENKGKAKINNDRANNESTKNTRAVKRALDSPANRENKRLCINLIEDSEDEQ